MPHDITIPMIGRKFARLTVIEREFNHGRKQGTYWRCICECGTRTLVRGERLRSGEIQSCGCLCRERVSAAKSTHKQTDSKEYYAWASLKQRCLNPKNAQYDNYGGRGITVCDRWRYSFEAFLEDVGFAPEGTSLDRIDNAKGYEPGNCRWATNTTQGANRRTNHYMTARGETRLMVEWAFIAGVRRGTIANRLRAGWSDEDAIFGRG